MNVSALSCQIPSDVKKYCLEWHDGRTSNMYRLATVGYFNPEKLLAEVEKRLIFAQVLQHQNELFVIKEYAENIIRRDQVELALHRAAQKVIYMGNYSHKDAIEYFRLCLADHMENSNGY